MLRRRSVLVVLLACSLAVLVAAPGAGAAKPHATRIVVSLKFPAFHGSLKSADDGCLGGRKLSAVRTRAGKRKALGHTTSNAGGKWKIPVGRHLTSGEYTVVVAPKGECKGARSKPLTID
jgi:hypothetical protein